jgi:hypothetical protein
MKAIAMAVMRPRLELMEAFYLLLISKRIECEIEMIGAKVPSNFHFPLLLSPQHSFGHPFSLPFHHKLTYFLSQNKKNSLLGE